MAPYLRVSDEPSRIVRWTFLLFIVFTASCSSITDVRAPDVVQPSALDNRAGAETRRAGAITAFTNALVIRISVTAPLTDELFSTVSTGFPADQRVLPDPDGIYPYAALQQTLVNLRQAISALQRFAPTPAANIGQAYALAGYTELFLAEDLCSGVPLGSIVDGDPVFAEPSSTDQIYARAIADFDTAIVNAADSVRILNLARVGRARALVDIGQLAAAAATVTAVPTSFTFTTEHSAAVQPNLLGNPITPVASNIQNTVADREGGNGLDFRSANDPRVTTRLLGKGPDGVTDVYMPTKYTSVTSPIVVASGIEARLIEAEALLASGDAPGALAKLNALRATMPGLAPLALEASDAARIDQLFRERAFWMFLTGHRNGDMRRLIRQYSRPRESVFPTGPYKGGQLYGIQVTFTPSASEFNNPNYHGCLSRDP